MGAECPPDLLLEAFCELANERGRDRFFLFSTLNPSPSPSNIVFHKVSDFVSQAEEPLVAIRRETSYSMKEGILSLKNKEIDLFLTAGNTGVLITLCKRELPLLKNVTLPTLLVVIPGVDAPLVINDVGGQVMPTQALLVQNAFVGASYHTKYFGTKSPVVALLNIGKESYKGPKEHRLAFESLSKIEGDPFTFIGNIEPQDVLGGKLDVLVSDGFSGNIFLKIVEGLSANRGGTSAAFVAGIEGVVAKVHSSTTPKSFQEAIRALLLPFKSDI
jgi:fatty acid/phospholipid biosynthesis enzyme